MKNAALINFLFSGMLVYGITSHAASSTELTCRANAKEVAAAAYRTCISDSKQAQIDQIRKDYQKRLADLKSHYDKELKKIGKAPAPTPIGSDSSDAIAANGGTPVPAAAAATALPPKASKGIAKALPTRKESKGATPPVQQVQDGATTVAVPGGDSGVSGEDNSTQAEPRIELVPSSSDDSARSSYPDGQ